MPDHVVAREFFRVQIWSPESGIQKLALTYARASESPFEFGESEDKRGPKRM